MKYIIVMLGALFLFSGCAVLEPDFGVPIAKKEVVKKKSIENNITNAVEVKIEEKKLVLEEEVSENKMEEEGTLILNVFADELYFEKDKVGTDKTQVVIKHLIASSWEKKALKKVYKKHKQLWSQKQSKNFRKILEEDKYLALCSDRKYWDNLEFEESEPERDILHSILLIKYLNNLAHGCPQWISSKVKNENDKERINTKQVFSLLPHGVIIEKLLSLYLPKEKEFDNLLKKYKKSLESNEEKEILNSERLEIEEFKCKKCQPNYKKRRK